MDDVQKLLWKSLEGALGPEKTAQLRNTPKYDLVRNKVASDIGLHMGATDNPLKEVSAIISAKSRKKRAEYESMRQAQNSMEDLGISFESTGRMFEKLAECKQYRICEESVPSGERQKIASARQEADRVCLDRIKESAGSVLSNLGKKGKAVLDGLKEPAKKGLGIAAGASIPTVGGGYALSEMAENTSQDILDDAQRTALETGGALGGMALLGYGGKQLIDGMSEKTGSLSGKLNRMGRNLKDFVGEKARQAEGAARNKLEDVVSRFGNEDLSAKQVDGIKTLLDLGDREGAVKYMNDILKRKGRKKEEEAVKMMGLSGLAGLGLGLGGGGMAGGAAGYAAGSMGSNEQQKTSSVNDDFDLSKVLEKSADLASAVYIDDVLNSQPELNEKQAELSDLNTEYAIDLAINLVADDGQ